MKLHISTRFGVTKNTHYYTCHCIFGRVQEIKLGSWAGAMLWLEPVNHERQRVIHQSVMLLIHLKSRKIHLIFTFKQCVCNSVNFFLDHKQNKAKLRCTSHLFSWNSSIDLVVICDPDSIVRWMYTPEIESAPSGELNWVFGKGPIHEQVFNLLSFLR